MTEIKSPKSLSENEKLDFIYKSMLVLHNRLDLMDDKIKHLMQKGYDNDHFVFYNDTLLDLKKEIKLLDEEFTAFGL